MNIHENVIMNISLDKEVSVNFWKSSGSEVIDPDIRTLDPDQMCLLGGGLLLFSFSFSPQYYGIVDKDRRYFQASSQNFTIYGDVRCN